MMGQGITSPTQFRSRWFWFLILTGYAAGSAIVLLLFIYHSGVNGNPGASFNRMIAETADKPYVQRLLLPVTVRLLVAQIPPALKTQSDLALWNQPWVNSILSAFQAQPTNATEAIFICFVMWSSLIGFCLTFQYFLRHFLDLPPGREFAITLGALVGVCAFFQFGYIYDFTTLFLFLLLIFLLITERWIPFLLVFFLSCWNKETTILVTLMFLFYSSHSQSLSRIKWLWILGIQLVYYAAVRGLLFAFFRNNSGALLDFFFPQQLHWVNGHPLLFLVNCVIGVGLLALIRWRWAQTPAALRWGIFLAIPIAFLYVFFGYPLEIRVFYEVYPVLFLLILIDLGYLFHRPFLVRSGLQNTIP